jgi:quercetin dioxygenase-like cupin family protein
MDDKKREIKKRSFIDLRVCPIPPNQDLPEHTHDEHTVHVISKLFRMKMKK